MWICIIIVYYSVVGSKILKGSQNGMTACRTDSVIIDDHARATIAQKWLPEKTHSHVRMRWMHDPDPHPL